VIDTQIVQAATFTARVAARAAAFAKARAESALRARRGDPSRWRMANLLWPLFLKDR
jgi:hypothetical protein